MVTLQREIMSRTIELSREVFGTFCDDISTMFGPKMQYIPQNVCYENIDALKARFSKLVAVFFVKAEGAEGALDGTFQLIFDRGGLFTLAGLTIMPQQMTSLLERIVGPQKIMDNIKSGTLKEAEEMSDALAEVGNMLVGAWDRVFRERLKGHKHFVQTNVFIGNPWDKPEEKIGLASGTKTAFSPFKIKVDSYPPFYCGVIFPQKIFGDLSETELKVWAEGEAKTKAEAETRAKAKAEAEAEANIEAEKSKAEAEEGKIETEKGKAEAEKVKAEAEKVKAEAEKVKAEAEKAKAEAEKAKAEAEAEAEAEAKAEANMEAEKAKAEVEKAKAEAEKAKLEAEKAKAEAEKAKAEAEKAKVEAEKAKLKAAT